MSGHTPWREVKVPRSYAADMADIVRECCARVRADLTGPVAETADGAEFSVTSGVTGRRFRVTVTEDGP